MQEMLIIVRELYFSMDELLQDTDSEIENDTARSDTLEKEKGLKKKRIKDIILKEEDGHIVDFMDPTASRQLTRMSESLLLINNVKILLLID